jgi:2'-5' RNA ligase
VSIAVPAEVVAVCKAARVKYSNAPAPGVTPDAATFARAAIDGSLTEENVRAARVWTSRNTQRAPRGMSAAAWQTTLNLYGGSAGVKWLDHTVSTWNLQQAQQAAAYRDAAKIAAETGKPASLSIDPASVHIDKPAKIQAAATVVETPTERGVAVVLPVPADVAAQLALSTDGAEPATELHLTLAFLGTTKTIDDEQLAAIQAVVREWAATQPPVTVSGSGRFCGDDKDAHYLSFDSSPLADCRESLCATLDAAKAPRLTQHGFTPHITLQYLAKDAPTPAPLAARAPLTFDRAALWVGDERHEFPFPTADAVAARQSITTARAQAMKHMMRGEGLPITLGDPRPGSGPEVIASSVIQIARVGAYRGHRAGPFQFTPAIFDQMVANLDRTENHEVPLDYEHGSEALGDSSIYQNGAPAVAWIKELENRGEAGLFATVDWVDAIAVGYVRSKRYKYFSPPSSSIRSIASPGRTSAPSSSPAA